MYLITFDPNQVINKSVAGLKRQIKQWPVNSNNLRICVLFIRYFSQSFCCCFNSKNEEVRLFLAFSICVFSHRSIQWKEHWNSGPKTLTNSLLILTLYRDWVKFHVLGVFSWYLQTISHLTLISLINVEPTLTDFEKFHPPQKKNPPSTFIDLTNIFQPPRLFQPPRFSNPFQTHFKPSSFSHLIIEVRGNVNIYGTK